MKYLAASALLALSTPAFADQTAQLRGLIEAVSDGTITIAAQDGASHEVKMADDYTLVVYSDISISELGMGDYLSIPSITASTGEKQALSINVFPPDMYGTAEGVQPWDLGEDSHMTNATIGEVISAADGTVLLVAHESTIEPILVPNGTEITRFAPVPDRRLEPGDQAVIFATQSDGHISSSMAGISEDGSLPPV